MLTKLSLAAVAATLVALSAFDVQAFPSAPSSLTDDTSQVIEVRGGCGWGRHRGPRGGCRWNRVGYRAWARGGARCWWNGRRRVCAW